MSQAFIGTLLNWLATGLTIEEGFRSITHDGSKAISDRGIPHLSEFIDYKDVPDDLEMYVSEADEYIAQYHNELHETILTSEHRNHFIETFYKTHPDCRIHRSITDYYLNHYLDQLEAALKSGTTLYDLFISKQISCAQETANDIKKTVNEIKDRHNIAETDFYKQMKDLFDYERENHPSIRMMKPDSTLFPKGIPELLSDRRFALEKDEQPRAIKDMILDSWKRKERNHILLVGEGGIGKTVAMLTLPEEEWFKKFEIPVIYVPLQRLDEYEGNLNFYLREKLGSNYYDQSNELANRRFEGCPRLLLLLDGFNEIPDNYKQKAGKYIRQWMEKPGIQIITTSRMGFSLENHFSKYRLQPLPYETVKDFLLSAGIKEELLPQENGRVSKVINVPLMLTIYTKIEKVKEEADYSFAAPFLEWKEPDNAAHIIWDYLQMELYRCIEKDDSSHSVMKYAIAILVVAPYICCQMSHQTKFYIKQGEFIKLIREALIYYDSHQDLLCGQILDAREEFDPYHEEDLLQETEAAEYAKILIDNRALFQKQRIREGKRENKEVIDHICSLMHQNFRDALAAFFICSCLLKTFGRKEKKELLDHSDYYVKNYMAEHLSEQELVSVWDQHREEEPEDGQITFILLDLIGRQRDYDYRELDFSGLDLTKTNLNRILSRRLDICPLPRKKNKLFGTKLSIECLSPNGHKRAINSIAYSSDRRHLASADDGTVLIWNLETGESSVLDNHLVWTRSVTYSPDSRYLAIADNRNVLIWDLEKMKRRRLGNYTGGVNSVTFSPDGKYVACGSDDGTVQIWNLESKKRNLQKDYKNFVKELEGHSGCVNSVVYSPDGEHLASGADDGTVRIWDLKSRKSRVLKGHKGEVLSVAYSPDGSYIASGAGDGTVRIWNLKSRESRVLEGHGDKVNSVAYSPDGRHLVSGATDRIVRIWDSDSGESRLFEGHAGWVNSVAYSPDGRHLASASSDRTVRIWDLESDQINVQEGYAGRINSVAYSPDGRNIAGGADDRTVRIWDLEKGKDRVFEGHTGWVNSVAYSPDGRHLASGSGDRTVRIWDLKSGKSRVFKGHTGWVNSVAYSPDGRHLASGSGDGTVRVWNLRSGKSRVFKGHTGWVNSVAYSPDGTHLASGSGDGTVRVWNLKSGKSLMLEGYALGHSFSRWVRSVAYSPDGRYLVSGGDDRTVLIRDLKNERKDIHDGNAGEIRSIAYSPDGKFLSIAASDGMVWIWNLKSGERRRLESHAGLVRSIAYSADGRYLASGTDNSMVRIWDTEDYREVRKYIIIPHLNLSKANFTLSNINDEGKKLLEMAGAVV